jgi:hypothetical protein
MIETSPEKRAFASQWLIEQRLTKIRENMPPEAFVSWAASLDLLLEPLEQLVTK